MAKCESSLLYIYRSMRRIGLWYSYPTLYQSCVGTKMLLQEINFVT